MCGAFLQNAPPLRVLKFFLLIGLASYRATKYTRTCLDTFDTCGMWPKAKTSYI